MKSRFSQILKNTGVYVSVTVCTMLGVLVVGGVGCIHLGPGMGHTDF